MRWLLVLCVLLLAGTLSAQNNPPEVVISSNGTPIPNSGGINIEEFSTFNSAGILYDVDDPDGDAVGCTAVVSNEGAAVNWSAANFNVPSKTTPYLQSITANNGEFGPEGTVHVVTLTFSDGMADTIFSFTIAMIAPGGGGTSDSDGGGGCTTGTPVLPWALAAALLGAWHRRRRHVRTSQGK